ncbi:SDR family oxidoreductase [Acinetobacter faecalis]|uniref:SDR family oxidoreductase n=2 Tax=Acinetobacter faecalis TaxID=2665161 RepID=UPI002A91EFD2|nr:SDR family oxidoreductase [Acinetobacter faecalis]MDY6462894.1 SDR family oxidoreductase [Acinetobacter faecalis]MDY6537546.1 SDR family oxidoreductase [Acinetobacter faecalis]
MILVTGATGQLGSSVISQLNKVSSKDQFAIFARDEKKAIKYKEQGIEVRLGDFNQISSLGHAFEGITKLLLISTMEFNRFEQHKNVIDAEKIAGVKHIIYTGLAIQDIETSNVKDLMQSHFDTEKYIQASGLDFTFVRNTMYTDAIPQIIGEAVFDTGIYLSGGDGKVPYTLRREMGEAIANILVQDNHENKTYNITGDIAYSYADIAQTLGELSHKKIDYIDLDETVYEQFLIDLHLPEFLVYLTKGTVVDIKQHQYEVNNSDLKTLLGRPPLDLKSALKELYKL